MQVQRLVDEGRRLRNAVSTARHQNTSIRTLRAKLDSHERRLVNLDAKIDRICGVYNATAQNRQNLHGVLCTLRNQRNEMPMVINAVKTVKQEMYAMKNALERLERNQKKR